jgi:hypothetical protein
MNYYIEKHDIELILDALENYKKYIEDSGYNHSNYTWNTEEVEELYDDLVNQSDTT